VIFQLIFFAKFFEQTKRIKRLLFNVLMIDMEIRRFKHKEAKMAVLDELILQTLAKEGDKTGYGIWKEGNKKINVEHSTFYLRIKKLEEEGSITGRETGPRKGSYANKLYEITRKGTNNLVQIQLKKLGMEVPESVKYLEKMVEGCNGIAEYIELYNEFNQLVALTKQSGIPLIAIEFAIQSVAEENIPLSHTIARINKFKKK